MAAEEELLKRGKAFTLLELKHNSMELDKHFVRAWPAARPNPLTVPQIFKITKNGSGSEHVVYVGGYSDLMSANR